MTEQRINEKIKESNDRLAKLYQQYAKREKTVSEEKSNISMAESSGFSSLPKKVQSRYGICGTDEDALYWMKAQYVSDFGALQSKAAEINDRIGIIDKLKGELSDSGSILEIPAFREFINRWKKETTEYYTGMASEYRKRADMHQSVLKDLEDCNREYVLDSDGLPVSEKAEYVDYLGRHLFRYVTKSTPEWKNENDSWDSYRKTVDMKVLSHIDFLQPESQIDRYIATMVDGEADRKYRELVGRVTSLGKKVLDCSGLYVAGNGSINGLVKCSNGTVKVETVMAGGYNEGIIVNEKHGQCLHYRVLTHLLKEGN